MVDIYSKSELLGILQGFNPWWSGQANSVPEFRRLAWQACRRYLDNQSLQRAVLLSGPRRVGKTVILQQIADSYLKESREPKSIFYVSLDHPLLKLATLPQILSLYHETTVLRHLYAYHYRDTPAITYWRDSATNKEVDIIVKSPSYTLPVEVKFRANADLAENDGLVVYCRREKISRAYFITQSEADFGAMKFNDIETSFLKIPAHIFTYLLGQAERLLWID